ncbi:hypothetical protein EMPS_11270 [Entomortierella parvispora]|uniref:Uncharacterized protein n=1 Tax=Entomortierella parvispora TaxID=205924 RepID=A0A9P3M1T1_9FUNG|nr:hypothetical protein EMPS_11270 [Entomortierella parvispora]
MKFSILAAVSAIALAATSDAATLKLFNLQDEKGNCRALPLTEYGTCYTVSEFYLPRSASFLNQDSSASQMTLTFYETGNCGGKYTRASATFPTSSWSSWGKLGSVNGIVGSVMLEKTKVSNGDGSITQYKPATFAQWQNC